MKFVKHVNYDVNKYNLSCPICNKKSKNNKALVDHFFHRNLKDENHKHFAKNLREEFNQQMLKKAKHLCPACKEPILRSLARHLHCTKDERHQKILQEQEALVVKLLKEGNCIADIERNDLVFANDKWILRILHARLGKEETDSLLHRNFILNRKKVWASKTEDERKIAMQKVRKAEWGHLTPEQRKNHPWVIAGRLASLKSSKRGSQNQQYAFQLLCKKMSEVSWIYNHTLDENWQVDIAAPDKGIYIEWDGRHHRILIHGQSYLNNRKNRDKLKNRIVTEQLKGTMIRVEDNGRFNPKFVEEKVEEIVVLVSKGNLENKVYYL